MTSLGLILLSRPLGERATSLLRLHMPIDRARRCDRGPRRHRLIVTVAAQAAVLPLLLGYFGRLSPVSLLTNCLVLPVQPAILAGGIAALLAGAAWQPLGQVVGTVPWLLLSYTVGVVPRDCGRIPFASVDVGRVGPLFVLGYYLLLAGRWRSADHAAAAASARVRRAGAWSALFVVPLCLSFLAWQGHPDGRLHVVFVPGENGEAAVVVAPGSRTAWIWDGRGDGESAGERSPARRLGAATGPTWCWPPAIVSPWPAACVHRPGATGGRQRDRACERAPAYAAGRGDAARAAAGLRRSSARCCRRRCCRRTRPACGPGAQAVRAQGAGAGHGRVAEAWITWRQSSRSSCSGRWRPRTRPRWPQLPGYRIDHGPRRGRSGGRGGVGWAASFGSCATARPPR